MISFFAFWPQPAQSGVNVNVAVSGTSANTVLTKGRTYQLVSTTDCYVRPNLAANTTGGNQTATNTDILLPARTPMVLLLDRFDSIAAVQVSASGVLGILEVQTPI